MMSTNLRWVPEQAYVPEVKEHQSFWHFQLSI